MQTLTDTESAILAVESAWWPLSGPKEQAIRERIGLSATRFYQELNRLIDTEAALAAEPLLVKRLRRIRDRRQLSRIGT